jgi:hypothetical protein
VIFGTDVKRFDWNESEKMHGLTCALAGNILVGLGPFGWDRSFWSNGDNA